MGGKRTKPNGATIGGQFNSIGSREEQEHNVALVVRLLAELGPGAEQAVSLHDRLFLQDVKIKINQAGSSVRFGWRQVERMVQIHKALRGQR